MKKIIHIFKTNDRPNPQHRRMVALLEQVVGDRVCAGVVGKMKYPEDFINKIICGDCLEVLKTFPNNSVDLVLTDPPYNAKDIGPNHKVYGLGQMQLPKEEYALFCKKWFDECMRIAKESKIVFTPGIANTHFYPQPFWQICWHKPAAVSFNRMGGYNSWEPVFCYAGPAKAKRIGQDYIKVNTLNFNKGVEKNHPCPKVKSLWNWLVDNFCPGGGIVLDPFMGSGTTAICCKEQEKNFIGIEINPDYCKIAEQRLHNVIPDMFLSKISEKTVDR